MGNIADHIAAAISVPGSVNDKLIAYFAGAVRYGSGSPEGVVAAPVGAIYHRTNGGVGTSVYIKESGSGATGWTALEASAGGVVARQATRTAALTLTGGTGWANVDTGLDLVMPAAVGDMVEVGISCYWDNTTAVYVFLDAVSVVSGNPALNMSLGVAEAAGGGVPCWTATTGIRGFNGGSVMRPLVSGDISGGNVTLRLRHRESAATNRALVSSTDQPLQFWAKNLGPQS